MSLQNIEKQFCTYRASSLSPIYHRPNPPPPPQPPINNTTSNEKEMFCFVTYRSVYSFLSYVFFFNLYVFIHGNEILRHRLHAAIRGVRLEVWIECNTLDYRVFTHFCNNMISKLLQLRICNCFLHF